MANLNRELDGLKQDLRVASGQIKEIVDDGIKKFKRTFCNSGIQESKDNETKMFEFIDKLGGYSKNLLNHSKGNVIHIGDPKVRSMIEDINQISHLFEKTKLDMQPSNRGEPIHGEQLLAFFNHLDKRLETLKISCNKYIHVYQEVQRIQKTKFS